MWSRNAVGEDLIMSGRRQNRPSMIKQNGTREEIGLERLMEMSRKSVLLVGLKEGPRLRGYKLEGRVLEEAVPRIMLWIIEGYLYNEQRNEGEDWLWGKRGGMGREDRWDMIEKWNQQIENFQRPSMGREAMMEYMKRRKEGFLPRVKGRSAPGAGGVLSFYQREELEEEESIAETAVEKNEVADALISAVAFGGREIIRFKANQLRAIEREGKRIMGQSSAQIDEEVYEIDINRDRSVWKIGMINQGEVEEGEFEARLGDFIEDAVIWIELVQIDEKERAQASDRAMHLEWQDHRGSYVSFEAIGIFQMQEWCHGVEGLSSSTEGPRMEDTTK
jgi:hypothetical protein